jgi:hypothetical protein
LEPQTETAISQVNAARLQPGQRRGHYESFFQRANHPDRPLAFWVRYTAFSPKNRPDAAVGELWAAYFDGERGRHVAVKRQVPLAECHFSRTGFSVRVADAHLDAAAFAGSAASGGHAIAWDLALAGGEPPLFLLPRRSYARAFPSAKSLVAIPLATYSGLLRVDDTQIGIDGWAGSQNHNWGSKHTDRYAWGQVAGFDTHPTSFLEVATARLKLGPLWTPAFTPMVLRHRGQELRLNTIAQSLRARGSFDFFTWSFQSEEDGVRLHGTISAPREAFVGFEYANPPGGTKHCLNSKIASCTLTITRKGAGGRDVPETLATENRAAFEILTDARDHGVHISA